MQISYDATRLALYSPESRDSVFESGTAYSLLQEAVEAARLAYFRPESLTEGFPLAGFMRRIGYGEFKYFVNLHTGTQGFGVIHRADRKILVSFRGTQPDDISDLATDIQAYMKSWKPGGKVHAGFAMATLSVVDAVSTWLEKNREEGWKVVFTGHSLGGAIATLLSTICRPTLLVTLGSPRVGDADFASALSGISITRLVNCCDAVTQIPPEMVCYTHVAPPTYLDRNGKEFINPSEEFIETDRLIGRTQYLAEYAWKIGMVLVRDLADHAPINYVRAYFH